MPMFGGGSAQKKGGVLGALQGFFEAGPQSMALLNGDFASAATIGNNMDRTRLLKREADQKRQMQEGIYGAMIAQGMSPDQAMLAMSNSEKFGEEYNTRFRTRDMAPGHTIFTPGLGGGTQSAWTAPQTYQNDADIARLGPQEWMPHGAGSPAPTPQPFGPMQSGTGAPGPISGFGGGTFNMDGTQATPVQRFKMQTAAEQFAGSLGLKPGSDLWNAAVRDFVMKGDGPTAFQQNTALQDARLRQQDVNNLRTTGVSRENSIRGAGVSRENNIRSTTTARDINAANNDTRRGSYSYQNGGRGSGGRGRAGGANAARIVNPQTGKAMVLRNGQWVPE